MFMERPEALTDLDFISGTHILCDPYSLLPAYDNEAGRTLIVFIT